MTRLARPCLTCGQPTSNKPTYCSERGHDKEHERTRRPTSTKRGYDRQYREDRAEILTTGDGQRPLCSLRLPGCTYWADTADHVDPVSLGGARGPLRPACKHCNSARGNRDVEDLRRVSVPELVTDDNVLDEDDDGWFPTP